MVRLNLIQKRTSFYNRYSHGPTENENPSPPYWKWTKEFFTGGAIDFAKSEYKRIRGMQPFRNRPVDISPDVKPFHTYIFDDFDSESMKRWKAVADSTTNHGYSKSQLGRSEEGHMLFSGILDQRVPENGISQVAGYAALIGPRKFGYFPNNRFFDWTYYNTFEIRFRGDGRKYVIVVNTGSYDNDISFYDCHSYPLYTKGGPYWQTVKIPFSKFIFNYKGLVQDVQFRFPAHNVKFVAIALSDRNSGPFKLEIDYLGLRQDHLGFKEVSPYETYSVPHLKYRQLQVDC